MVTIMSRMLEIIQVAWWLWCLRLGVSNPPTHPTNPPNPTVHDLQPPNLTPPAVECESWNSKTRCQRVGYGSHIPKPMKPELIEKHQVQWLIWLDPATFPTTSGKFSIRFGKISPNPTRSSPDVARSHRILDGSSENSPNLKRFRQFFAIFNFTQNQPPPNIHSNYPT